MTMFLFLFYRFFHTQRKTPASLYHGTPNADHRRRQQRKPHARLRMGAARVQGGAAANIHARLNEPVDPQDGARYIVLQLEP